MKTKLTRQQQRALERTKDKVKQYETNSTLIQSQNEKLKITYGIGNLRLISYLKTEICPLTILVGRNHVGKSSLLRTFPLIKQSIDYGTNGPISWHKGGVDYGDYNTTVKSGYSDEGILFEFGLENYEFTSDTLYFGRTGKSVDSMKLDLCGPANVSVLLKYQKERTFRFESKIELPDHDVVCTVKSTIDGKFKEASLNGGILPVEFSNFTFRFPENHILSPILPIIEDEGGYNILDESEFGNIFVSSIGQIINSNLSKKLEKEKLEKVVLTILEKPRLNSDTISQLEKSAKSAEIKEIYKSLNKVNSKSLTRINSICGLFSSLTAYNHICQFFSNFIGNSLYYKPARTVDKRSFQIFGAGETDIFPDGSNLSGFYESLSKGQLASFTKWMKERFEYNIMFEKKSGRTCILVEQDGIVSNLVDSGFGISEVLPILTQIWWESVKNSPFPNIHSSLYSKSVRRTFRPVEMRKLIAIEQPELHLHPALQARLADVLVETIYGNKTKNRNESKDDVIRPTYIIETHSESLINRLGQLVHKGKIDHDDIQILVFSKSENETDVKAEIREVRFSKEGNLTNWPYGFFRFTPSFIKKVGENTVIG